MPSGTGVIGPSGVLTGSFSVGRKHVPSDNYRDKTWTTYNTGLHNLVNRYCIYQVSLKNMLLWQQFFRRRVFFFPAKSKFEVMLSLGKQARKLTRVQTLTLWPETLNVLSAILVHSNHVRIFSNFSSESLRNFSRLVHACCEMEKILVHLSATPDHVWSRYSWAKFLQKTTLEAALWERKACCKSLQHLNSLNLLTWRSSNAASSSPAFSSPLKIWNHSSAGGKNGFS